MPALILLIIAMLVLSPPSDGAFGATIGDLVETEASDPIVAVYRDGVVYASELSRFSPAGNQRKPSVEVLVSQLVLERELVRLACSSGLATGPDVVARLSTAEREAASSAFEEYVGAAIRVTSEEIRRRYEKNIDIYVHPPMVRLQNIFIRYPTGATESDRDAVRKEGAHLHRELLDGADFTDIAQRYSDSQTRHSLGFVGFVRRGQLPPPIETIAFALAPGEISELIESSEGITILKCVSVRPETITPLDEVADSIRRTLMSERLDERWREIEAMILAAADLRVLPTEEGAGPDAVEATCTWGGITRREFDRLVQGVQKDRTRATRRWAVLEGSAHRARRLGLDRGPDARQRADRRATRILADAELQRLTDEHSIAPTDEDIRRYWSDHRSRFVEPETARISVIRLSSPSIPLEQRLERAWVLADAIDDGTMIFEEAARIESDHPSAADSGRLPALTEKELAILAINVAKEAEFVQPGETSRPVVDGSTVWLIRLDERTPEREHSFEESRTSVRRMLERNLRREARAEIADTLLAGLAVEILQSAE